MEDERFLKVILSASQHTALEAAAETCIGTWDGTGPDDVAEQAALAGAQVALANAEEVC